MCAIGCVANRVPFFFQVGDWAHFSVGRDVIHARVDALNLWSLVCVQVRGMRSTYVEGSAGCVGKERPISRMRSICIQGRGRMG